MPKHQTPTASGTLAHIRIEGILYRKHFKRGTAPHLITQWLLQTEMRFRGRQAHRTGRFDDDARVYLQAVASMPSYVDRKAQIEEWIAVFGSQYRHTITSDQIAAQLAKWRTEPRTFTYTRRPTTKPVRAERRVLSAASVNHRRTALMHLFSVLDGRAAPNPVKDAPKYRTPTPQARGLPYSALRALWRAMRDTPTRARLQMMAYTGLTQRQVEALLPEHLNKQAMTLRIQGRAKGKGSPDTTRPITQLALTAFRAMARNDAWGTFSRSNLRRDFRAACRKVPALAAIARTLRPYDLRHSFGTEVYRVSGDIRATQVLMGHSSPTLTHRYTLGAVDERVTLALTGFGKRR